MKKIKFLNGFLLMLIIFYIIHFSTFIYIEFCTDFNNVYGSVSDQLVFGVYTRFIWVIVSFITFVGLIFLKKGINTTIKKGYFNQLSIYSFNKAGLFFIFSGSLSLILNVIILFKTEEILFSERVAQDFLLLFVGFSLFITIDIIKNGNLLQVDKDLTI